MKPFTVGRDGKRAGKPFLKLREVVRSFTTHSAQYGRPIAPSDIACAFVKLKSEKPIAESGFIFSDKLGVKGILVIGDSTRDSVNVKRNPIVFYHRMKPCALCRNRVEFILARHCKAILYLKACVLVYKIVFDESLIASFIVNVKKFHTVRLSVIL